MSTSRDPARVRAMFDRIAPRYDRANTVLSLGRDASWRRRAAEAAALRPGASAIDIACGTGRLAAELRRCAGSGGRVVGVDASEAMLAVARESHADIEWMQGDAADLPFAAGQFDAAAMAFGLRNLQTPEAGLAEMRRVVRPGGRLVVLEFLRPPPGPLGRAYRLYLRRVLPAVAGRITGEPAAYAYLSDTVDTYLSGPELQALGARAGWPGPHLRTLNTGTVALLTATV